MLDSSSLTRPHGKVPFRWALSFGQLFFCVLLLWPVRGVLIENIKRSTQPEIRVSIQDLEQLSKERSDKPEPQFSIDPVHRQALRNRINAIEAFNTRERIVTALNLPAGLVQVPYAIFSPSKQEWTPGGMDFQSWRAISWPLLAMPFWWVVGRGIEALLAGRQELVEPRIRLFETAMGFALCSFCAVAVVGFALTDEIDKTPQIIFAIAGFGLWSVLAGSVVAAFFVQWRIRHLQKVGHT